MIHQLMGVSRYIVVCFEVEVLVEVDTWVQWIKWQRLIELSVQMRLRHRNVNGCVRPPFCSLLDKNYLFIYTKFIMYEPLAAHLGAPGGSAPMAWYYDSQLHSSLRSFLARRAFGAPKNTEVDASIDIFLVASLKYHLI